MMFSDIGHNFEAHKDHPTGREKVVRSINMAVSARARTVRADQISKKMANGIAMGAI